MPLVSIGLVALFIQHQSCGKQLHGDVKQCRNCSFCMPPEQPLYLELAVEIIQIYTKHSDANSWSKCVPAAQIVSQMFRRGLPSEATLIRYNSKFEVRLVIPMVSILTSIDAPGHRRFARLKIIQGPFLETRPYSCVVGSMMLARLLSLYSNHPYPSGSVPHLRYLSLRSR